MENSTEKKRLITKKILIRCVFVHGQSCVRGIMKDKCIWDLCMGWRQF